MEQPPGSIDDLQPQDLSTSCIPTVIDLTRKGEECVLNSTAAFDALRMVRSPSWFPNSGNSSPGLQGFSETSSSDIAHQSGDQIQPDNAFSHTTVTLSYVSRSHVFSVQDTLSQHSPLYSVPPISKFSLHPPRDTDKGLGETGYALNQHFLEQVEGPEDLATQTELFQSSSQAQGGPENNVSRTQDSHECNSGATFSDGDVEKLLQGKEDPSLTHQNSLSLENCNSGACAEFSLETVTPVTDKEEEKGGSEVRFLVSKKPDQLIASDSVGARDLCSLSREYISPLEDPVSPSATSLDDVEDVFVLPQASSSPSGDNSYLETAEGVLCDSLNTEAAIEPSSGTSDGTTRLDSSDENKQPGYRRKAALEPMIDLTDDVCAAEVSENNHITVIPHMNGNAKALERSLKEKKLPIRSGRGTRLEAIVMNINSSRYKVSGCIRTSNKVNASQSTSSDSTISTSKRNDSVLAGKRKSRVKVSVSAKPTKQKAVTPLKRGKSNNLNTDNCKDSTSDSEMISNSKKSQHSTPPKSPRSAVRRESSKREPVNVSQPVHPPQTSPVKSKRKTSPQSSPQFAVHKNSKKEPELLPQPDPSVEIQVARFSPPSKSPKKNQGKAKSRSPGSKTSPTAKMKAARTPKRRRKKHKQGQSASMFSPKEPEIKLKYVNYKEDKRDLRTDSFSPFIHVERQQSSPSLCTVINYPEEVRAQHKKGQQQQANTSGFISAVVPSTSCLQLGRVSTHGQHQRPLICCLCGQSANAMDLGDLHGPYYPEGYQPSTKTPASTLGLKEDDYSDSDSSSCSVRGRGRKCATVPALRALRPGAPLKKRGLMENHRWTGSSSTGSPAAKQARSDASSVNVEDWYSPPMLLLEPCEYWLHEDCGIWSAGVFLVKGKVYGLEEAVKVAQETTCSACHDPGAMLGCFFKGCPNKYHYRCALESDCVLIEENFSMKCKKHKNKTFKAPSREQMGRKVTETS